MPYASREARRASDRKRYWEMKMQVSGELLEKVTLNLFQKDMDWLRNRYNFGVSEVIRNQVRKYINQIRNEEDAQ